MVGVISFQVPGYVWVAFRSLYGRVTRLLDVDDLAAMFANVSCLLLFCTLTAVPCSGVKF